MEITSLDYTWAIVNAKTKIDVDAGTSYEAGDYIVGNQMDTADGGTAVQIINKTGAASVKGTIVDLHSDDNSFQLSAEESDTIGVVYEAGVADGALCWLTITGKAKVMLVDATASTAGYWVYASDTAGRANATSALPPGGSIASIDNHFKEIGHCLESKTAGTDVLALINLHFN